MHRLGWGLTVYALCAGAAWAQGPSHLDVERALRSGRDALRARAQQLAADFLADPPPRGEHAVGKLSLACLALLRAGEPPSSLDDAFRYLATQDPYWTYDVALYALALDARWTRRLPPGLVDGGPRTLQLPMPERDATRFKQAVRWLLNTIHQGGTWAYGGPRDAGWWTDHSNTQFGVHALAAAERRGVSIPKGLWVAVLDHFVGSQERDGSERKLDATWVQVERRTPPERSRPDGGGGGTRTREGAARSYSSGVGEWLGEPEAGADARTARPGGWSYVPNHERGPTVSMTGAGLFSLATAYEVLRARGGLDSERQRRALRGIRDGVAWLAEHYTWGGSSGVAHDTPGYQAFSTLKALTAAGVETLAGRDWWAEGASALTGAAGFAGEVEGSMFLLWLARGVLPPAALVPEPELEAERVATGPVQAGDAWDAVRLADGRQVRARRQLQGLLAEALPNGPRALDEAQQVWDRLAPGAQRRLLPELWALLAAEDRSVVRWARRACEGLVGTARPEWLAVDDAICRRLSQRDDRLGARALALEVLADGRWSQAVRRAALDALVELGTESLDPLLAELSRGGAAYRRHVDAALRCLAGDGPRDRDAEAWADWVAQRGPALQAAIELRRDVSGLSDPVQAAAASERLRGRGIAAADALIGALLGPAEARRRAHGLLVEITGEDLPPSFATWLAWREAEGS
jgi:hypothetical protein